MTGEKIPPPPPLVTNEAEDDFLDEGDRPTRSVPAAILAEIYQRPPSSPPPAPEAVVPTNGLEPMIITDAMLGKPPRLPTKTVKMTTMPLPKNEKK